MLIDASDRIKYFAALDGNIDFAIEMYKKLLNDEHKYGDFFEFYEIVLMCYNPRDAVRILKNDEFDILTTEGIEYEYIVLIAVLATILGRNNEPERAAYWARKGLDIYGKFKGYFGKGLQNEAVSIVKGLDWLHQKYQKYIDDDFYGDGIFCWEKEYFETRNNNA